MFERAPRDPRRLIQAKGQAEGHSRLIPAAKQTANQKPTFQPA